MKNVTEMTIEELNAERARLNDVINATLAGMTNENEQDLQERLDNIVLELHDRERDGYTAQLSIGRGTMASTMVLTVAFQKNRDIALASLIEKIIANDYKLALQLKDVLDEKIQERDEALIGKAMAILFPPEGTKVVASDIRGDAAEQTKITVATIGSKDFG